MGMITALTLVAFLAPIERFGSLDQIVKYCGLCPSAYQSGERGSNGKPVRDCTPILQWVLVEAQWRTIFRVPSGDVALTGRRIARRKSANDGAIAAARKLLRICCAVLRRGTPSNVTRLSR